MPNIQREPVSSDIKVSSFEADPRFCFAWHSTATAPGAPLVVVVHGSERGYQATCRAFLGMAQTMPMSILAPHFPVGPGEPGYEDGYKFLAEQGIDYVAVLMGMVEQFNRQVIATAPEFYLFGFSGGAQFAHRFAYFEARHLAGLVVSAPGTVTLADMETEWWPGLAGAETVTGRKPDLAALRRIPVAVTVGAEDIVAGLIRRDPGMRNGSVHADMAGTTRVARARSLHQSLRRNDIASQFVEIGGAGHDLAANADAASKILGGWLATPTSITPTEKREGNA